MNAISIIGLCFSGIMMAVGVTTFVLSRKRDIKKDTVEEEHELASLREGILKANMKLDTVCATTNETRADIKALNTGLGALDKRVSVMERDLQTAFIRIDELRESKEDKK